MCATSLLPLIDSHCHLDFDKFDFDRSRVLSDAFMSGVIAIIDPGVDLGSSLKALQLAESFDGIYVGVGLHPNEANKWENDTFAELEQLATNPKVVAIGEIGLDYYRDRVSKEKQIHAFREQLRLAEKLQLPVIIHNREATSDILELLSIWVEGLKTKGLPLSYRPGVLHSFSADESAAERCIGMNFFIGITGPVTFPNAKNLQRLVANIPLDHLLIETDAPFLSPQAKRGHRNEPAYVRFIADKIATLKNIPFEEVAKQTTKNAQMLFQIGEKSVA